MYLNGLYQRLTEDVSRREVSQEGASDEAFYHFLIPDNQQYYGVIGTSVCAPIDFCGIAQEQKILGAGSYFTHS